MTTVTTTKDVLQFINTHKGKTKKELALLMGLGIKTFEYHYTKLYKNGDIKKIDDQTKLTSEVLKKLEEYFMYGLTDKQACYKVEIGTTQFYNYCRENPSWAEKREVLKDDVIVNTKILVAQKVKEKDEGFSKMVYQQHQMKERAEVKVSITPGSEDVEEEVKSKNVSLKVTIMD